VHSEPTPEAAHLQGSNHIRTRSTSADFPVESESLANLPQHEIVWKEVEYPDDDTPLENSQTYFANRRRELSASPKLYIDLHEKEDAFEVLRNKYEGSRVKNLLDVQFNHAGMADKGGPSRIFMEKVKQTALAKHFFQTENGYFVKKDSQVTSSLQFVGEIFYYFLLVGINANIFHHIFLKAIFNDNPRAKIQQLLNVEDIEEVVDTLSLPEVKKNTI
jgi:hypothetical protein